MESLNSSKHSVATFLVYKIEITEMFQIISALFPLPPKDINKDHPDGGLSSRCKEHTAVVKTRNLNSL